MALVKIKIQDEDTEKEVEVEELELETLQFNASECTPGDEKCVSGVKLKCKTDGSGWFKIGTC